jgi:hypothetical protein
MSDDFEDHLRRRMITVLNEVGDADADEGVAALYAIAIALVDLRKSLARDTDRIMSKLNLIAGNLKQ